MVNQKTMWKSSALWNDIRTTLSTGHDIVVYDVETTGLSPTKDRIIELAAVKYAIVPDGDDFNMVEKDTYHQYLNPERSLPDIIVNLTGITDAMLSDKPTEAQVIDEIAQFFDGCVVSGYNIETFDNKFLNELFGRFGKFFRPVGIIDCIKIARNRLQLHVDVENFKLATIGACFGIEFEAHSAIEDARTTGKLIQLFIHEYVECSRTQAHQEAAGTLRPHINTIAFWPGFKGFSRIYINMDVGSVYYDVRSCDWGGKDIDIQTIDMNWLEQEVYRLVGVTTESEFAKFKGTITV